jgi:hypothetical protein
MDHVCVGIGKAARRLPVAQMVRIRRRGCPPPRLRLTEPTGSEARLHDYSCHHRHGRQSKIEILDSKPIRVNIMSQVVSSH